MDPCPRHCAAQRPVLLPGEEPRLQDGPGQSHITLHLRQHRATPARIALRGGQRGGAGSCRRRLGRSAHGTREECSFLCPAHPARAAWHTQAWLSAWPGPRWGALAAQAMGPPHVASTLGLGLLLCTDGSQGGPSTCELEHHAHPGTRGPTWRARPPLGGPGPLPTWTPDPNTAANHRPRAKGAAGSICTLRTHAPLLPEPGRHPKAARTHRLAPSPPPAPQHPSPGMPWEAEASPSRCPATALGKKCFLNEIKRGLFSMLWWCPKNPAQGYGD